MVYEEDSSMNRSFVNRLVEMRKWPVIGRLAYYGLVLLGSDIPREVKIGKHFWMPHWGLGVVIHPNTTIGDRVTIFTNVTIGRADAYRKTASKFEGVVIEDDAVICTGTRILCKEGILTVGRGTVVGANAVLLKSTGEWEVWVGAPARCVGKRDMAGIPVGHFGAGAEEEISAP
jgi:serine O-acetyltransferase